MDLRTLGALALVLALAPVTVSASPNHHRDRRQVARHDFGRPASCAGIPWCGCWLRLHLGIRDARLNLARAWASFGSPAPGPDRNVIAVWPHHVGLITANIGGGLIRLLSGNDGHAVRERVRTTRGIIAYRHV